MSVVQIEDDFGPILPSLEELRKRNTHSCAGYDWKHGVRHDDCLQCGAVVVYTKDEPGASKQYDQTDGGLCSTCGEVFCASHLTQNTPDESTQCRQCSDESHDKAREQVRTSEAAHDAVCAMNILRDALKSETNVVTIKEVIKDLHTVHDTLEAILRDVIVSVSSSGEAA